MVTALAYYNEFDPYAAAWLRNLIAAGHIAPGVVDERSIEDVTPNDLRGFTQCHFFAGLGAWSYALRRSGWPDDRAVWTGSCPCQPFSAAGKGAGFADERHLWPAWHHLIRERRPEVIFGEQVASSVVLGQPPAKTTDLQALRDREDVRRVLREFERRAPYGLHSLRNGGATKEERWPDGRARGVRTPMEPGESSEKADVSGEVPSGQEGLGVRSKCRGPAATNRYWSVSADRHTVQFAGRSDMGQPITGQDRCDEGLHDEQHSAGAGLCQRDGEHLGRGENTRDCGSDPAEEAYLLTERGAARAHGPSSEGETSTSWLDLVQDDLEALGYAFGAIAFPACGVGAPHIRRRAYFVAHSGGGGRQRGQNAGRSSAQDSGQRRESLCDVESRGMSGGLADTEQHDRGCQAETADHVGAQTDGPSDRPGGCGGASGGGQPGPTNGFWRAADWLACRDGKWRPVSPLAQPLVDGAPARVGRLRAFGNAIVAPQAVAWIESYLGQ